MFLLQDDVHDSYDLTTRLGGHIQKKMFWISVVLLFALNGKSLYLSKNQFTAFLHTHNKGRIEIYNVLNHT